MQHNTQPNDLGAALASGRQAQLQTSKTALQLVHAPFARLSDTGDVLVLQKQAGDLGLRLALALPFERVLLLADPHLGLELALVGEGRVAEDVEPVRRAVAQHFVEGPRCIGVMPAACAQRQARTNKQPTVSFPNKKRVSGAHLERSGPQR